MSPPYNESPHSSLAGSYGTPDTRLTAFSPEDSRVAKVNTVSSLATPQKQAVAHDPFVSAQKPKLGAKELSPIAPAFVFQGLNMSKPDPVPGSADHLINIIQNATAPGVELIEPEIASFGILTTSTLRTRNLRISSLSQRDPISIVEVVLVNLEQSAYKLRGLRRIASAGGSIYLKLDHIDDVCRVHSALQAVSGDLAIEFISAGEFAQIVSPQNNINCSAHEGQVVLHVSYMAKVPNLTKKQFGETILGLLQIDGELCAWKRYTDPGAFHLVAEYVDINMAPRAIARLNGQPIGTGEYVLSVTAHEPDLVNSGVVTRYQPPIQTPTRRGEVFDITATMGNMNIANGGMSGSFSPVQITTMNGLGAGPGFVMMAPTYTQNHGGFFQAQLPMGTFAPVQTGFAYTPQALPMANRSFGSPQDHRQFGNEYSPISHRDGYGHRRAHQNRVLTPARSRGQNSVNTHHNIVEVSRIKNGSDVRTTVMLRNIPNKVDQAMLKAIIDETSFGRYDFLYLRIDFSNNCNVGYAFINFVDPLDIVEFVETRANKPWDSFKSDKIAEVSYATIQGRDCLIQKFRNSSVMLEPPHYRPKLFFTFTDSLGRVGEEDDFPASDNASKLKRSCENAEHVGLFAPAAGQHMRDEQRRRRSQYDRGTSLAAREEFEYDPFGYSPY